MVALKCLIQTTTNEISFDRVVSLALGRPFALHDDDIDVSVNEDFKRHPKSKKNQADQVEL